MMLMWVLLCVILMWVLLCVILMWVLLGVVLMWVLLGVVLMWVLLGVVLMWVLVVVLMWVLVCYVNVSVSSWYDIVSIVHCVNRAVNVSGKYNNLRGWFDSLSSVLIVCICRKGGAKYLFL